MRPERAASPPVIIPLAWLSATLLLVPILALAVRLPVDRLAELVGDPDLLAAMQVSAIGSSLSLVLSTVLGVPLAWMLARRRFPGVGVLRVACLLPMVLPPVVAGVALLLAFGRRGLVGGPLAAATGVTLPFSTAAVVLAATFVSMPFLVVSVEAGLRSLDRRFEEVASTLGAGRTRTFFRVTLPLVAPSLGAGMALAWTRALGEFGATITFAGNLPGLTQTMPLAVYLQLETDPQAAYLLSALMVAASATVLLVLRGRLLTGR